MTNWHQVDIFIISRKYKNLIKFIISGKYKNVIKFFAETVLQIPVRLLLSSRTGYAVCDLKMKPKQAIVKIQS